MLHEAFYLDLDNKILKQEEGNFEIAERTLHEGICLREIARVETAGQTEATQAKALLTSMKKLDGNEPWVADFPSGLREKVNSLVSLKKRRVV